MTKQSRDARLCAFLQQSLALWGVEGVVETGDRPRFSTETGATETGDRPRFPAENVVCPRFFATVTAADGTLVWIERADEGPFRWLVRWRAAGEAPGGARETRPRGCPSLLGVLSAMRTALGVDRGSPLRIAA